MGSMPQTKQPQTADI